MKLKKVKWIFVFLLSIVLSGIQAQSSLHVKDKQGTETLFNLTDIKTLTFNSGIITVNKRDGNRSDFAMIEIRYLNFERTTLPDDIASTLQMSVMLFPNPVKERMQVRYESTTEENVYIQIIDIQGKIVYRQNLKSRAGINYTDIEVGSFQKGIYLCRLQKENKIEMNKFIKD